MPHPRPHEQAARPAKALFRYGATLKLRGTLLGAALLMARRLFVYAGVPYFSDTRASDWFRVSVKALG